jgi:hypothetical protein
MGYYLLMSKVGIVGVGFYLTFYLQSTVLKCLAEFQELLAMVEVKLLVIQSFNVAIVSVRRNIKK